MKPKEQPLCVKVVGDRLVISIGLNRLNGNEYHPWLPEMKIKNLKQWGKDVAREIDRETSEQGNTPIGDLLDNCIKEAIEMGSDAVVFRGYNSHE